MKNNSQNIRNATLKDAPALITLWNKTALTQPWNDPYKDIKRALDTWPQLFFIIERDSTIIASAMAGYDGHRGAIYYFAVDPDLQHTGVGSQLLTHVEEELVSLGCPKINLCVRQSNSDAHKFYKKLGYSAETSALLGKRLIADD